MTFDESSVNSQVTDSVVQIKAATLDSAPVDSFAILDLVMTETVGMGMHNAVNAQQSMQMMASAAITATCARMINGHEQVDAANPKGSKGPGGIDITPPLMPQDPATIIQAAQNEANKAAGTLTKAALMAKQTVDEAKTALTKLGAEPEDSQTDGDAKPPQS